MKYILTALAVLAGLVSTGQVRLTAEQWKAVEGIFRDYSNPDMNIRFEAHGDTLFAWPLWAGNRSINLLPQSPLEFHGTGSGEGGNLRVEFKRDSSGAINELMINGGAQWIRNNHYQPLVRKEMAHTPEQVHPFEGLYQLEGEDKRYLWLFERNNRLILRQLWDGNQLPFLMQSELSFFMAGNLIFTLDFTKDEAGKITRMVAFKRDHWKKIEKLTSTPAALRQYEGKYQSKDDPDNLINIIARDSALVVKQAWDGKETAYKAIAENFFFNDAASTPLEFVRDTNGGIKELRLFENNVFIPVAH